MTGLDFFAIADLDFLLILAIDTEESLVGVRFAFSGLLIPESPSASAIACFFVVNLDLICFVALEVDGCSFAFLCVCRPANNFFSHLNYLLCIKLFSID